MNLDEPFAIYSRVVFDSYLRDRARDAGAEVVFEKITARGITKVDTGDIGRGGWKLRSGSGEWSGKMLVGADGANSAIAKKLAGPLPPAEMEVAFGYRAPLRACVEASTVVAFLPGWDGYAWAFPRPDHISFGIATSQITFDHEELEPLLWEFMIRYYEDRLGSAPLNKISGADLERGKAKFGGSIEQYAARIPKLREGTLASRRTGTPEWALLGDAAGFADAVTGEGIYYALRSAELFAAAYADGCPESYESRWRKDFGRDLARASKIRKRFYGDFMGDRFTERMIHLSILHGGIQQTLMDLVAGDLGYVNLKRTLLKRFVLPFAY